MSEYGPPEGQGSSWLIGCTMWGLIILILGLTIVFVATQVRGGSDKEPAPAPGPIVSMFYPCMPSD